MILSVLSSTALVSGLMVVRFLDNPSFPWWCLFSLILLISMILIYRFKKEKSDFLLLCIYFILFFLSNSFRLVVFGKVLASLGVLTTSLIMAVSSGSEDGAHLSRESGGPPALESSSSSESLATFRNVIAAENEAEIYVRIRNLENLQYYNLPPQNNQGDYERIVRENFDQAIDVPHYRQIMDREYFELRVLERKGFLQEKLHSFMLEEDRLSRILELSPYSDIRKEAFHFIQDKLEPLEDLRHPFQRHLMDGSLDFFRQQLEQHGRQSEIYREFYEHFTDHHWRRLYGLPLP